MKNEKTDKVIIFGAGQNAAVVHSYLQYDSNFDVVAFTVDREYATQDEMFGLPLVPFDAVDTVYPPSHYSMLVFTSFRGMNSLRQLKYAQAKDKGYRLISYVSSKATVFNNSSIGENCVVMDNVTVQPCAKIGDNVAIWSGSIIGHHSVVGDHCFIASHTVLAGSVVVGAGSFLGLNSTIADGVTVAEETLVGAGSVIHRNTVPKGVYITKSANLFPKRSDALGELFKNSTFAKPTARDR